MMLINHTCFRIFFGVVLLSMLPLLGVAQRVVVNASIDSTAILIGEQTVIHLDVTTNKGQAVLLPVFPDTIMRGIEVIEMLKPDTSDLGNDRLQIRQDYLITSFDSSLYRLPPFLVVAGEDSAYSNSLGLKVSTLPVDVETKEIYDIKDVMKPPFVFSDYLWILWIILGIIIVTLIIVFIVLKMKGRAHVIPGIKKEPDLPPHVRALMELDELKARKLWQQGKVKDYHSKLTDALRRYIEERFNTPAPEMTSGEILNKVRNLSDADSVYDNLKQILQLADFVKFAKYNPLPDENQLSMVNAYLFINQTKKEEVTENPVPEGEETNAVINEQKQKD